MFYPVQASAKHSYFTGQKESNLKRCCLRSTDQIQGSVGDGGKGRKKAAVHEHKARNKPDSLKLILDVMV